MHDPTTTPARTLTPTTGLTAILTPILTLGSVLGLILTAACDNGPSAVKTRDRAPETPLTAVALAEAPPEASSEAEPAPKTVVTANRRETVDAKISRLFARNGAAFGARTPDEYLTRLQAFTRNPPADADSVKRPNGDTLYYQASTNTFAVVARDGTPRTMFKPDTGTDYWAEQKAKAPSFGRRRTANPD